MSEGRQTPKAQAEELQEEILKGKKTHEQFVRDITDQILVSGQPMSYWEDRFKIIIPTENINPSTARDLSMKLLELSQEATFLYNAAVVRAQLIKHGSETVFLSRFERLVKEYETKGKKRPAQGVIENLAKLEQADTESAKSICEVEVKFWKGIIDHISRCQSILKNASMMIATDLKAMSNDEALDELASK